MGSVTGRVAEIEVETLQKTLSSVLCSMLLDFGLFLDFVYNQL